MKKLSNAEAQLKKGAVYEKKQLIDFSIPVNIFPEFFSQAPDKISNSLRKLVALEVGQTKSVAMKFFRN